MEWICTVQYNKFTVPLKIVIELHLSQVRYSGKINISLLSMISKSAGFAQYSFPWAQGVKTVVYDNIMH